MPDNPQPQTALRSPLLLERETQIATIGALIHAARAGTGGFAVIEGGAGIGKTRLCEEARAIAGATGMRVLTARGGELEGEFAFGVVRQLFEPLLTNAPAELRAELLGGAAELVAQLFDVARLAASPEPSGESFAVLHGLYWLAANAALQQPMLLAVDDLHWADTPSLRWLSYLARRLDGLPLLVVAATRPPEAEAREPTLVGDLIADPAAVAIRPGPLGRASIAALAQHLHGLELEDAFARALETATAGNPLFVHAVLDTVAREGIDPIADEASLLLDLGAQGVSRVVARRLTRLPPAAASLLRAAAVLGDRVEPRHAAALAGVAESELGPATNALVRADLVRREQPLEFTHPVVRSAVHGALDIVERSRAHRRAAELLLEAGAAPENAAAHLLFTAPAADPFVISTLRQAADRSLAEGAAEAATGYLRRALEEQCDQQTRAAMLMELGLAERRTDEGAAVNHLRAALDLLADPARRGVAAHELGRALWFNDRIPEALHVFEQALDEVDRESEPALYELLLAELIGAAWWEPDTYPLAEQQIATLDLETLEGGFGSEVLLATMSHYEYRLGADRERAVDRARRALASGRLLASGTVAFTYASQALDIAGLFREARSLYDEAVARARRRGDIVQVALFLMWRGKCATHAGDLPAALGDLREAIDLGVQHGLRVSSPYNVGFLAEALLEQGNADDAERVLAESGFPEGLPPNLHLIPVRLIRGRLRAEGSDPARGLDELLELGDLVRRVPFDNPGWLPWRCAAAEALRRLDRTDEAVALVGEELVLARRWGAPHAIGAALRMLGLLKGGTEGEPHLRQAVSVLAGSEARLEHARALVELGAALRRRNQRSDARALLREGAEFAQALGATGLAERANEEIAATGARPRKPLQTGIDALTASERRVAQLATEGMSNKEIAQALFVTVKTVEVHLSSVYRKLHINSRAQLGKALMTSSPADAEPAHA